MDGISWVKIDTNVFENQKIRYLKSLAKGTDMVLIWFMLIVKAGQCNEDGALMLAKGVPYTINMLANEFGMNVRTVAAAIKEFEKLSMIEMYNGCIVLPGWEEHQNIETMEKVREQARDRKRKQRDKQRDKIRDKVSDDVTEKEDVTEVSRDSHVTEAGQSQQCPSDVTLENREERIENKNNTDSSSKTYSFSGVTFGDVDRVCKAWNAIPGIPSVSAVPSNSERGSNLRMLIVDNGIDQVLKAINKIKDSDFLQGKGKSSKGWVINFDWFLKEMNFMKVLEGTYDRKANQGTVGWTGNVGEAGPEELETIRRMFAEG